MAAYELKIGECCFCKGDCNPLNQSCGSCARSMTGFSIGINKLPIHLRHVYSDRKNCENESDDEEMLKGLSEESESDDEYWKKDISLISSPVSILTTTPTQVSDTDDEKMTTVYYTGLGVNPGVCYHTEREFRRIIHDNRDKFPFITQMGAIRCSLRQLVPSVGGKILE